MDFPFGWKVSSWLLNMCHFKNQSYLFTKHLYMRTLLTLLIVPTSLYCLMFTIQRIVICTIRHECQEFKVFFGGC